MDTLREVGVRYVFCGHYHKNAEWKYKHLEVVVICAIGPPLEQDPRGFSVVTVEKEKILHEYVTLRERTQYDMYKFK